MTDPVDFVLAICVLAAILALGALITIGNERVRQATLQVRQVVHEYALADLALRREQVRRSFSFADQAACLQTLEQIALDASKERHELTSVSIAPGLAAALIVAARDGMTCIFAPSAEAFLKANPAYTRRSIEQYAINGLTSHTFAAEELEAVARWHGLSALPRTEEWSLLVLPPADYSLLPRRGLSRLLPFKWS